METSISLPADPSSLGHHGRGWILGVVAMAVAATLAAATLLASRSSLTHVRRVEVSGAEHLSRASIVRLSGVTKDTNALWLNEGEVERRLEQDPWIARAIVSTSFPWTVHIVVAERTPVAVIRLRSSRSLIAGDGTSLGPPGQYTGLPQIFVPPAGPLDGAPPSFASAARVLGALSSPILDQVREVVVAGDGSLELRLADGPRVEFGPATDVTAKARVLSSILAWSQSEHEDLALVNVVAPWAPSAVPRG